MSKRILVMEDEEDNRQIIRDMLAGIDCEITEAENGEEIRFRGDCVAKLSLRRSMNRDSVGLR
jgi:CheY-like chemotaxis protein